MKNWKLVIGGLVSVWCVVVLVMSSVGNDRIKVYSVRGEDGRLIEVINGDYHSVSVGDTVGVNLSDSEISVNSDVMCVVEGVRNDVRD